MKTKKRKRKRGSKTECKKCGRCCYFKTTVNGVRVFTNKSCLYLNRDTNLCTVYPNRFRAGVGCLPIKEAIENFGVPKDCAFVSHLPHYKGVITAKEAFEKGLIDESDYRRLAELP